MRILLTGASGFVGALLLPRLLEEGHAVRALARDPTRVARTPPTALAEGYPLEVVGGDVLTGEGLAKALSGVEVAYYLIHSMERAAGPSSELSGRASFPERERIAAHTFTAAASRAGVRRIVYLGGLVPARGVEQVSPHTSRHLASREEVERIILSGVPDSIALRASIVIGARSRSFRFLVRLVERLPVLALPPWRRFSTQPLDARDMVEMLTAAATATGVSGRSLDVGGPEAITYEEMILRIADLMLVNRPAFKFGVSATALTARVAAAIASEDPELIVPLMEGLQGDLLLADDRAAELLNVHLHSFDSAVEHALAEWERSEPLAAR
ncbi:MAG TPA: NAD(P)H-binding protein [Solirubrobacteraceae bacterium]|jgi:uncharacterized protein YbjT (DUF2867 family)